MSEYTCWCGHAKEEHRIGVISTGTVYPCRNDGCPCNAYRQRIPDPPTEIVCGCGHPPIAHDYKTLACGTKDCRCNHFYAREYTSTTYPPHYLYEDIYYDGQNYIDFKYIVSYKEESDARGIAHIDVSLENGYKFSAMNRGGETYLYRALERWHDRMGNLLDRKWRSERDI